MDEQQTPRRDRDCPEKDGRQGGSGRSEGPGSGGSADPGTGL